MDARSILFACDLPDSQRIGSERGADGATRLRQPTRMVCIENNQEHLTTVSQESPLRSVRGNAHNAPHRPASLQRPPTPRTARIGIHRPASPRIALHCPAPPAPPHTAPPRSALPAPPHSALQCPQRPAMPRLCASPPHRLLTTHRRGQSDVCSSSTAPALGTS